VAIHADVELGGTDQRFNLLAGRHIQPLYQQKPQDILMTNLIMGMDSRKMSSSWGNTINLTDAPNDMFGKTMTLADDLIIDYLVHCTRVPMDQVNEWKKKLEDGANPRDAKVFLAKALVSMYHSAQEADAAEAYFVNTFSKGEVPEDVREVTVETGKNLIDFLVEEGLATSKGDARRKVEQGGVSIAGDKITNTDLALTEVHNKKILKVGKKDFVRIVL
jgi:tyrosyl-tRNA synthetase